VRAAVYDRYGSADVVRITEMPPPVPAADQVLIRIKATSVNRTDCAYLTAKPWINRMFTGLTSPKRPVLGNEFAGEIEATGAAVRQYRPGDRVFGISPSVLGCHADYLCLPEDGPFATMPHAMTFQNAGAICDGALLTMSALRKAALGPGTRMLINGVSGSMGVAGLQLAKAAGAHVTGVCSTRHVDLVRSLGADEVIDYTREDFTHLNRPFDVVFDAVGKSTWRKCRRLLTPNGIFIPSELGFMMQNVVLALGTAVAPGRTVHFNIPNGGKPEIERLRDLIEADAYRPVIDRQYPLEQIADAYAYVLQGHKAGNVIVSVS
jgi:NADPH:quinone reductase-like Zn-dependent oxidoreductase